MLKFILCFLLSTAWIAEASERNLGDCSCCTENVELGNEAWKPDEQNSLVHKECFIEYIKNQLKNGNSEIRKLIPNSIIEISFYTPEFLTEWLLAQEQTDLEELLNKVLEGKKQENSFLCPTTNCKGVFPNTDGFLPVGKICGVCEKEFMRPPWDDLTYNEGRICPHCKVTSHRWTGCDNIVCHKCEGNYRYNYAPRLRDVYKDSTDIAKAEEERRVENERLAERQRRKEERRREMRRRYGVFASCLCI